MALQSFKNFAKELTEAVGSSKSTTEDVSKVLWSAKSGVHSLDDVLKNIKITREAGVFKAGNKPIGVLTKLIRQGNIEELAKLSSKQRPFTSVDALRFREITSGFPEQKLDDVARATKASKRKFAHLDTKPEDVSKLSISGQRDLRKIESNLFRYFKEVSTIALTLGSVYVGVDWLVKATQKRRGCFMLTTINNKTTSCRVREYSCIGESVEHCSSNAFIYYNTTIILMNIAQAPNDDANKIFLANIINIPVDEFHKKLPQIIDTKFQKVSTAIDTIKMKPMHSICTVTHPGIENGIVPPCRMCDPTADPKSTTYIDSSQLPINVTFHCSTNPSILDTVADV